MVIDVSEKLACEGFDRPFTEKEKNILIKAIGNGTPLPKGHGDLIDKSLLYPDSDYDDGLFYAVSMGQINGAPTIIEADKAESEKI